MTAVTRRLFLAIAVAVFTLAGAIPVNAQGEIPMVYFAVIPIERFEGSRGPQYFRWMRDPDPENSFDVPWSAKDFGSIDQGVIAAELTLAQRDQLAAHADVYVFPTAIDVNMPSGEQTALQNFLEAHFVPASNWLTGGNATYRQVLRTITGMFLYMQRVTGILSVQGLSISTYLNGITLNTRLNQLDPIFLTALQDAAISLGYTWTFSANTQLRIVLKSMADQWGAQPILFGFVEL